MTHLDRPQLCRCEVVSCQNPVLMSHHWLGVQDEEQCHALSPLGHSVVCPQFCLTLLEMSRSLLLDHLQAR